MSIFASKTQQVVAVEGGTITIRKLTGREVEQAQAEHLRSLVGGRSARGWAPRFQRLVATGKATEADAEAFIADPLNGYDRATVLRAGVVGWSFEPAVSAEMIEDLDDDTSERLAVAIMRLTKPATVAEVEGERKNG